MNPKDIVTIEDYILEFPEDIQAILIKTHQVIKSCVPKDTTEKISWGMPTFSYHGNLVHFAAAKKHLGLYPGANGVAHFEDRLKDYKHSKGAIQFPYKTPIPYDFIKEIVQYLVLEREKTVNQSTR